ASTAKVGFYGLDLYSLHSSIEEVLRYLNKVDPEAATRASYRYSCFDHYGEDTQTYGYAAGFGLTKSCENEVVTQLLELRRRAAEYAGRDGRVAEDEYFYTEQNARLVKNAEGYYRSMFHGIGLPRLLLSLRNDSRAVSLLRQPRLERAIGVIYLPETERQSHYFYARLADQFDAVLHFDRTRAVEPLDRTAGWESGEVP